MATFNIEDILTQVYGFVPPKFEKQPVGARKEYSDMGAPFYAKTGRGVEYFMPVKLGGVQLPFPLISIDTPEKYISKRKMRVRDGEHKVYMGKGDYRIYIRGLCVGENGAWPEEQVQLLKDLEERNEALDIENVLTAMLLPKEQQCVLMSPIRIAETKRLKGVVEYQMELASDVPFALEVTTK
ncbi:MAG: DUF6046 domain-containing protein [Flavipsychrobacter sp.]